MNDLALRFIRWGTGLMVLGLLTGYGPLGHYLMGGAIPSCPASPVHGHSILLGWVGMTLFGLVYKTLTSGPGDQKPSLRLVRWHFNLAVIGMLGAWANGTFGYAALSALQPSFYYEPHMDTVRLWFGVTGFFLTVYAVGCALFAWVVLRSTAYSSQVSARA